MATSSRSNTASSDAERPWLHLYDEGVPPDLAARSATVLEAFDRVLAERPHDTALWYFDSPLSYDALSCQADRLAASWAGRVESGDRVAILNQNTPASVVGLLASWRLGASIAPLNPMLTAREIVRHLDDAQPAAVIVGAEQAQSLHAALAEASVSPAVAVTFAGDYLVAGDHPRVLSSLREPAELPHEWDRLKDLTAGSGRFTPRGLVPGDIAFLTYTSGTTGLPKAALNTHANVAFNAEVYRRWLELGPSDVIFAAAPFSHVTGLVAHIAAAFESGAPMVLGYRFEPSTVLELVARHGCTTTVAAITAYIALLDSPTFDADQLRRFTKLYSGGAPVAPAVVERWERATGVYIRNAYGLTETTSPSHLAPLARRAPVDALTGSLSVGTPTPGTRCRLADPETGEPLGPGETVGELLIAGPQVVAGYWKKPEETARGFKDGWLRTGDLARVDDEGWFYIVDRVKDVIVASGFKVWPREVEDVLLEHPAVSEAAVIGVPDEYRGETPKAFVVTRPGEAIGPADLISFCRERLAPYKAPRLVEIVEALPKTASGKVLRRALRDGST